MADIPYIVVHCNLTMSLTETGVSNVADVPWLLKRAQLVRQLRVGHIDIERQVVNTIAEAPAVRQQLGAAAVA